MGRFFIIALLVFFTFSPAQSQHNELWKQVDQDTYSLYLKSDWKELRTAAERAITQGVDFYYLRVRLGMAYFFLGRYDQSRQQFNKALKFQKKDPVATEYLYYSDLYAGRFGEARRLLADMTDLKRTELKAQAKYSLQALVMEAGWMGNNKVDQMIAEMPQVQIASSYLMRDVLYANVGLAFNLGYSSSGMISYNRYNINFIQGLFVNDSLYSLNQTGFQNGAYLNYVYQFDDSWYGGIAYHGIKGNYKVSSYQETESGNGAGIVRSSEVYSQSYLGVMAGKHFNKFNVSGQLSRNTFWDGSWVQAGFKAFWYPAGSTDYYLGLGYDRMKSQDSDKGAENAYKITCGFTMLKYLQIEASHSTGDLGNWADMNGYYIFNTVYPILNRTSATLIIKDLSPYLRFSFTAVLQNRSHEASIYYEDGSIETVSQKFQNTSFFGGITWIL